MNIALAGDHAGYALKQHLVNYLREKGHTVLDLGVDDPSVASDYPDVAQALGEAVQDGRAERGILVCGSGVGASIAANKMAGIYCCVCHDAYSAAQGVEHDNMNVLAVGGRIIGTALAEVLAEAFLGASFKVDVERYVRRFDKIRALENNDASDPS